MQVYQVFDGPGNAGGGDKAGAGEQEDVVIERDCFIVVDAKSGADEGRYDGYGEEGCDKGLERES